MRRWRKIPLRRLVGGRESGWQMTKLLRAFTVAAMLAMAMLASGSVASADGGLLGKPLPQPLNITWEE